MERDIFEKGDDRMEVEQDQVQFFLPPVTSVYHKVYVDEWMH